MSNEIEKSNSGLNKSSSPITKGKFASGMMAGLQASLGQVELPRMFNQLVLFILDGSGSMTANGISGKTKGYEVHNSVINVLQRLQESKNKASFDVSFIAFAEDSVEMFPIKKVTNYSLTTDCFNPCEFIINHKKTNLHPSLEKVSILSNDYFNKYKGSNVGVLIIILGDGAINDYKECFNLKEGLNQNDKITFSSILMETPEWQQKYSESSIEELRNNFKNLASEGAGYLSTVDPEKIRKHMIQSITKVSKL